MDTYTLPWTKDKHFIELVDQFKQITNYPNSINTIEYSRLYILRQLAQQQADKNKNFVECGIYAGMSMFFVSDICNARFLGIDSFEGLSEPNKFDTKYFNKHSLAINLESVKFILKNKKNIELYKGWIPEVFNKIDNLEYSYVHIDVDLYEPTKRSIEYFWPKLIKGGVLICDDYGHDKTIGAKKAMDDFFGKIKILELPTGQAIVYKND